MSAAAHSYSVEIMPQIEQEGEGRFAPICFTANTCSKVSEAFLVDNLWCKRPS